MVPFMGLGESMGGIFTEDFCMCVVLGRDNLVSGVGCLVCSLFC
jgi:hypothetical protein